MIARLMFLRRLARAPLMPGEVAREGLEALQGRRRAWGRCRRQALAGRLEQELEEGAGVAVEGGEELVGLDVRLRVCERERRPLLDRLAGGARVDLDRHVLKPGARPQQQRGVRMDERRVLVVDLHGDDRAAALEVRPGDAADVDPGDGHRLALPGVTAWAELNSALSSKLSLPKDREPGREVGVVCWPG